VTVEVLLEIPLPLGIISLVEILAILMTKTSVVQGNALGVCPPILVFQAMWMQQ